jgi:hypothetical protein
MAVMASDVPSPARQTARAITAVKRENRPVVATASVVASAGALSRSPMMVVSSFVAAVFDRSVPGFAAGQTTTARRPQPVWLRRRAVSGSVRLGQPAMNSS